jgi:hypothetical protein
MYWHIYPLHSTAEGTAAVTPLNFTTLLAAVELKFTPVIFISVLSAPFPLVPLNSKTVGGGVPAVTV